MPVLKAAEARILLALAAANGAKVFKTYTKQAYLYCDMGDDVVYIGPPDWWPEQVPKRHVFLLLKSIDGYSSYSRALTERDKQLVNGILIFQHGWSRMGIWQ